MSSQADPAESQLESFIDRYPPAIGTLARAALAKLRKRLPGAVQLVYDNYNALVIGFGPSQRASEAILSLALYPHWINLFFLHGADLPDPGKLLKGGGKQVRSIRLAGASDLDQPPVRQLITEAVSRANPLPKQPTQLIIQSISAKQRPRRPSRI
jgi:hypothetical protein